MSRPQDPALDSPWSRELDRPGGPGPRGAVTPSLTSFAPHPGLATGPGSWDRKLRLGPQQEAALWSHLAPSSWIRNMHWFWAWTQAPCHWAASLPHVGFR